MIICILAYVGLTWCFSNIQRWWRGCWRHKTHQSFWIKVKSLSSQHLLWETVILMEVCYSEFGKRNLICALWLCMLSCHHYGSLFGRTIGLGLYSAPPQPGWFVVSYIIIFLQVFILLFLVFLASFILYIYIPKDNIHSFLMKI